MNAATEPTAPIVLFEAAYQKIFGSLDELLGYVEAIDVWNHEFTVFDARGREVLLVAESDVGPVAAELSSRDPDPEHLRERLADLVRAEGPIRYGLIDADVELAVLLRVLWKSEHPRRPLPG